MRRYTFTGPSTLSQVQEAYVRDVVRRLSPPPSEITTGAATGVDTIACLEGIEAWPTAHHRIIVPAAPHNEELIEFLENLLQDGRSRVDSIEIIEMPYISGMDEPNRRRRAYRARNHQMMPYTDELIALLRNYTFYRSGEFMTVNIAEDMNIPIVKHLLP